MADNVVVRQLTLKNENHPGALWSGLALALAAIHAYDGHALWRGRQNEVAKAWLPIAFLLLLLSADEIGSIHERVGLFGEQVGIGAWWPLLPFAIILLAMLGYAVVLLWRAEGQRRTAVLVLLGFFILGLAALHELVEHRIVLASSGARAIRVTLEEGTEIAGMLILLKVVLANTRFAERRGVAAWPCLEAVRELCVPASVTALLLAPLLAAGTAMYEGNGMGRVADWLAVVLLLGAALAVCRPALQADASRWPAWFLAGVCGVAALAIVKLGPGRVIWLGPVAASMRLLTLAVLAPAAIALWGLLHRRGSLWLHLLAVALMANLIALALLPLGVAGVCLVTQLLALAIYVALAIGDYAWRSTAAAGETSPPGTGTP